MKHIVKGLVVLSLLGVSVYLLMNGHPTAGGWLVFASIIAAWHTVGVE